MSSIFFNLKICPSDSIPNVALTQVFFNMRSQNLQLTKASELRDCARAHEDDRAEIPGEHHLVLRYLVLLVELRLARYFWVVKMVIN